MQVLPHSSLFSPNPSHPIRQPANHQRNQMTRQTRCLCGMYFNIASSLVTASLSCSFPDLPHEKYADPAIAGVGGCRVGAALGVGGLDRWIVLSPRFTLYWCRGVGGAGVFFNKKFNTFSSLLLSTITCITASLLFCMQRACEGCEGCEGVILAQKFYSFFIPPNSSAQERPHGTSLPPLLPLEVRLPDMLLLGNTFVGLIAPQLIHSCTCTTKNQPRCRRHRTVSARLPNAIERGKALRSSFIIDNHII